MNIKSFYQQAVAALEGHIKEATYLTDKPYNEFSPEVYIETKGIPAKLLVAIIHPLITQLSPNCRSLTEGNINFTAQRTDGGTDRIPGQWIRTRQPLNLQDVLKEVEALNSEVI